MISFKDFLTEARMAPLYHGARLKGLESIMKVGLIPKTLHERKKLLKPDLPQNKKISLPNDFDPYDNTLKSILTQNHHPQYLMGVSTTRSFKMATEWSNGIVFELDQRLLAQRFEIKPIQYFQSVVRGGSNPARMIDYTGYANEYEEFVITDRPITPNYFTRIYVDERKLRIFSVADIIDKIRQERGSSFIVTY